MSSSFFRGDGSVYSQIDASAVEHFKDEAAASAAAAETSNLSATASAVAAGTSEANAHTSEVNAATSEANAASSASTATAAATVAAGQATVATTQATNAATSASQALTSKNNAATSETNAANSATAANTSKVNAATSETNAAASASAAAATLANALTKANNLSDVTNAVTARSNLGINQTVQIASGVDLNTITSPGTYYCQGNGVNANSPTGGSTGQWYLEVLVYSASGSGWLMQRATDLGGTTEKAYVRTLVNSVWGTWKELAQTASPALTGTPTAPTASVGTNTTQIATTAFVAAAVGGGSALPLPGGALTVVSGDAAPEVDTTTSALYLAVVDNLSTTSWNGSAWVAYTYSGELTLTLTATDHLANNNYDVFEAPVAGVMTLMTGPAWTNATTRSITIENYQGRIVNAATLTGKNGANSYSIPARAANLRGGFRTSANGQTKSTKEFRLTSDLLRPSLRPMSRVDTTDSWSWNAASYHQANANAANQFAVFNCASGRPITVKAVGYMVGTTATVQAGYVGIGIDSSSVDSSQLHIPCAGSNAFPILPGSAQYDGFTGLGYHEYRWLESGNGGAAQTWVGDNGSANGYQTGINGAVLQ
jgi:hypothetical protein